MKGMTYLLLCGIVLSTIAIFTKLLVPFVSPFLIATIRVGLVCLFIFVYLFSTGRLDELKVGKRGIRTYIPVGFFGVLLGFGFYLKALDIIPVANAIFLMYIYPVVTALLAARFLKESMGRYAVLSLILCVSGIWMIYGSGLSFIVDFWGSVFALSAGIGYAVFVLSMKYMDIKGYSLWNTIFWPLFMGFIFLLPFAVLAEPVKAYMIYPVPYWLIGIGLVSFLGYYMYAKGLESIRAHNGPIIVTLTEPATAVMLAFILLGEAVPEYILFGGLLIIVANVFVQLEERKTKIRKRA
jgi:drug/metabolite transporter (DMT)-like permease